MYFVHVVDSVSSDEEFTFSDDDEGNIGVAVEHYETLVSLFLCTWH